MPKQEVIDQTYINIAKEISNLSNCLYFHVGAILVKEGRIISLGYNGSNKGFTNCCDKFEKYKEQIQEQKKDNNLDPKLREIHHNWTNNFEIHGEMNCLLFAARNGISTENTTLYCTHQPCHNCLKHLIQAGVSRII